METFALTADALPRFSLVVLTGVMFVAFAARPHKSAGSWWFVTMLAGFVVHHVAQVGLYSVYAPWSGSFLIPLTWSSVFIVEWASIGFAYRFLGDSYPRESRIVLAVTGAISVAFAAYVHATAGQGIGYDPNTSVDIAASVGMFIYLLITISVLVRRRRDPETPEATKRALHGFSKAITIALVFPFIILLRETGMISGWLDEQLSLIAWAVVLMATLTAHVSYAPEPTSFLVKVVGFAFVAVVTALGVASAFAFRAPLAITAVPPTAVTFFPDDAGGYDLLDARAPPDFTRGEALPVGDGQPVRTNLDFAFPFADRLWRDILIDDDGYVTFGPDSITVLSEIYDGSEVPWIAPLLLGMSPDNGGSVTFEQDSSRATVMWRDMTVTGDTSATATVRLVLDASGRIDFHYGTIPQGRVWVRGFSPATATIPPSRPLASGTSVARGEPAIDNRWRDRRMADHERSVPFAWLILGAGAFVLLAFPVYLREGLTRPLRRLLDGVRRAARGHLDTEVPVGARDEIGVLTEDFNSMTGSLRKAETALRAYADELEERVEARTAELATSLDDLRAAQAQLVQQEKMASLGALTAGIAHEIKNPLNFVNNFASLSRELVEELDEEEDPEEREAILADLKANAAKIEEHGRRADRIVRDMMDHARTGGGERQKLSVNALVTEYANLAYHGMRARHPDMIASLALDLDDDAGDVEVVAQEIGRVLINLVDNAFDAMRMASGDEMESAPEASGGSTQTVGVSTRRASETVEIRVTDTGPGIDPEIAAKVFEPFFTTKPTGSGTGLGLSMSYDIVTQGHGGTLTVESEPGDGATFVIHLPLAPEA